MATASLAQCFAALFTPGTKTSMFISNVWLLKSNFSWQYSKLILLVGSTKKAALGKSLQMAEVTRNRGFGAGGYCTVVNK